jgi:hypothetical protein
MNSKHIRLVVMALTVSLFLSACFVTDLVSRTFNSTPEPIDCVEAPQGLVSWWPGDGSMDDITGSNTGHMTDGDTYTSGKVDLAFTLAGGNRIYASTAGLPTGSEDRTLEFWVKLNNYTDGEDFFAGYGRFGNLNESFHVGSAYGTLFFSQWSRAIFGPNLELNTWYHVAVTLAGSRVTLYLNGKEVAAENLVVDTPTETMFYIGSLPNEDRKQLDGLMDEVSLYDRALTADEVRAIYAAGTGGKCK